MKGEEISEWKPLHISAHIFLCGFQTTLTVEVYLISQISKNVETFISILHIKVKDFEDGFSHDRGLNKTLRWHQ